MFFNPIRCKLKPAVNPVNWVSFPALAAGCKVLASSDWLIVVFERVVKREEIRNNITYSYNFYLIKQLLTYRSRSRRVGKSKIRSDSC